MFQRFTTSILRQGYGLKYMRPVNKRFCSQQANQPIQKIKPKEHADERITLPINLILGIALGTTVAGSIDYVLYFPEPAKLAFETAKNNPVVQESLGDSITRSYFWDGSVKEYQSSVSIPVSGSKGTGVVSSRMVFDEVENEWKPLVLMFRQNDTMVNLLPPPPKTLSAADAKKYQLAHGKPKVEETELHKKDEEK